jgi:pyrroloquinoline quinone (PQQ) biosynthesis protein C
MQKENNLTTFIHQWKQNYQTKIDQIPLFKLQRVLSDIEIEKFVRYFYHIRGHFNQLLFVFADTLPKEINGQSVRGSISENMEGELGLKAGLDTHNNYYYNFATSLGFGDLRITEEVEEKSYLDWIKKYNTEHRRFCYANTYATSFGAMYAYEILDNIDYTILFNLVTQNISECDKKFFEVHKYVGHDTMVEKDLDTILSADPENWLEVQKGFDFIGHHQLQMWNNLNNEILLS